MLPKLKIPFTRQNKTSVVPFVNELSPKNPNIYFEFNNSMNFDGCSKGNPGIAGAGAVIYCLDDEIWSGSSFVGKNATNNQAEYNGLLLGLQQAINMSIKSLLVKGDSQLVINQMTGIYKCNSENILELYKKAKELETQFDKILTHIWRHCLRLQILQWG